MQFVTILSIIVGMVALIYAGTTCPDILEALGHLTSTALKTDSCSTSTSCDGTKATADVCCTYSSPLTSADIKQKCDAVKSAVGQATSSIADCTITCTTANAKKTFQALVVCNPTTSKPASCETQSQGKTKSSSCGNPLSLLTGLLDSLLGHL